MAAHDNSPHLKQVLHNYKSQAMNSLQGPGPSEILLDSTGTSHHTVYPFYGFKKALLYGNVVRRPDEYKNPDDSAKLGCLETRNSEKDVFAPSSPFKLKPDDQIKEEIIEKESPKADWVEPRNFLAPAPFPPKPWPVLASADPGQLPRSCRSETILDGEPIACFNIGGELRLCLPQILNTVLQKFSLTQINAVCDELQIYYSRCTPPQLDYLKDSGVLPPIATSCGLITKTDAQRLTHALLYRTGSRTFVASKDHLRILVSHSCFGKCKGAILPELYTKPDDLCVECLECHGYFSPSQFVCHAHRALENRICHWGFDCNNWRVYLTLSRDQGAMSQQQAETHLKAFKSKFDPSSGVLKRKQQVFDSKDETKKPRVVAYDNPRFEAVFPGYVWGTNTPLTVIPIITKDRTTVTVPTRTTKESITSSDYLTPGCQVLVEAPDHFYGDPVEKGQIIYQHRVSSPLKVRHKLLRNTLDHVKHSKQDEMVVVKIEPSDDTSETTGTESMKNPSEIFIKKEIPADLELSTTDSDTESVSSNASKSEIVEEAEALLRGFNDRAAAKKVLDLVESIVRGSQRKDKQIAEALKERDRLQEKLSQASQTNKSVERKQVETPQQMSDPCQETPIESQ